MPRPEKVQVVAEIKERLEQAQAVFLAEYAGLSVNEQQQMRRALRETEGQFQVVKMTLARLAAAELGHDDLADLLSGPTGLTFADHDAAATAKALQDFAKEHAALVIKGALLGGEVLPPEKVSELADLPARDVLLAQIAGAFQAPMAKMAGLMAALPRDLATMVQQLIEKLPEEAAAAEPADEPADEPVEEAAAPEDAEATTEESADEEAADEAPAEEAAVETADTETGDDAEKASDDDEAADPDGSADDDVSAEAEASDEAEEEENDG